MKPGDLVRFNHERNGGPVHKVTWVDSRPGGMVQLHDMGGHFAPCLFVAADDVAGIPAPTKEAVPHTPGPWRISGRAGAVIIAAETENYVAVDLRAAMAGHVSVDDAGGVLTVLEELRREGVEPVLHFDGTGIIYCRRIGLRVVNKPALPPSHEGVNT